MLLCDGSAAMMAYAKMQFSDISNLERQKVEEGLLRYCKLDTLAVVMVFEFIEHEIERVKAQTLYLIVCQENRLR